MGVEFLGLLIALPCKATTFFNFVIEVLLKALAFDLTFVHRLGVSAAIN